jgi:hypothetical protein
MWFGGWVEEKTKGKRKREKGLFGCLTFELFFFFLPAGGWGKIMPPLDF